MFLNNDKHSQNTTQRSQASRPNAPVRSQRSASPTIPASTPCPRDHVTLKTNHFKPLSCRALNISYKTGIPGKHPPLGLSLSLYGKEKMNSLGWKSIYGPGGIFDPLHQCGKPHRNLKDLTQTRSLVSSVEPSPPTPCWQPGLHSQA